MELQVQVRHTSSYVGARRPPRESLASRTRVNNVTPRVRQEKLLQPTVVHDKVAAHFVAHEARWRVPPRRRTSEGSVAVLSERSSPPAGELSGSLSWTARLLAKCQSPKAYHRHNVLVNTQMGDVDKKTTTTATKSPRPSAVTARRSTSAANKETIWHKTKPKIYLRLMVSV